MNMNSYYTNIPQKSYDAYVRDRSNLDQVLCALIVDPDDAADAAKEYGIELPHSLEDFQSYSLKFVEMMKQTIAKWAMTTNGANDALRELTTWDLRFGVWCACAVARQALRFAPKGERRPLQAIETAEAWVIGKATQDDVGRATNAAANYAYAASRQQADDAAFAAANAATAAFFAANYDAGRAGSYAADAAVYAASAAANEDYDGFYNPNIAELRRLRGIVANACLTFPG